MYYILTLYYCILHRGSLPVGAGDGVSGGGWSIGSGPARSGVLGNGSNSSVMTVSDDTAGGGTSGTAGAGSVTTELFSFFLSIFSVKTDFNFDLTSVCIEKRGSFLFRTIFNFVNY